MTSKTVIESKTVWFNVVTTLIGILPIIAAAVKAITPETAILIDAVVTMVVGVGNVILRVWFTNTPIVPPQSAK